MQSLVYAVEGRALFSQYEQVYDLTISVEDFTGMFLPPPDLEPQLVLQASRRIFRQGWKGVAVLTSRQPVWNWERSARHASEGSVLFHAEVAPSEYVFLSGAYEAKAIHERLWERCHAEEIAVTPETQELASRRLRAFLNRRMPLIVRVLETDDLSTWDALVKRSPDHPLVKQMMSHQLLIT